jgi:sugar lactone lactonase YvrE
MRLFCLFVHTGIRRSSTAGPRRATARRLLATLLAALAPGHNLAATRSTGVGFQGLQTTVAIGFGIPHATAIDTSGNLYVTDLIDSRVLKVTRGATGANCTITGSCAVTGSGFVQPTGLALDASGNLFVTDASTQSLYKITAAGVQTTVASSLASASGVALASDGSAYVAVSGAIKRVTSAGAVTTFASGPAQPGGIALGSAGNLYVADVTGNRVLEFAPSGTQTTLASGFNAPQSVALDGAGNLYVADTGNNRIIALPSSGAGYVCPASCNVLALTVSAPNGVVSDAGGDLYIADTGNNQVVKLAQDVEFGSSPVLASNANPAASLTLNYLLYSSSCAAPPSVSVLTRGTAGKDFTYSAAANVCTPGSGSPDSLAITVNFAPLSPGLRTGSVQFTDSTGVTQVATYLHGVGQGAEITWTPGVVTTAAAGSGAP